MTHHLWEESNQRSNTQALRQVTDPSWHRTKRRHVTSLSVYICFLFMTESTCWALSDKHRSCADNRKSNLYIICFTFSRLHFQDSTLKCVTTSQVALDSIYSIYSRILYTVYIYPLFKKTPNIDLLLKENSSIFQSKRCVQDLNLQKDTSILEIAPILSLDAGTVNPE